MESAAGGALVTRFAEKSFSVGGHSAAYAANYDAVFGRKEERVVDVIGTETGMQARRRAEMLPHFAREAERHGLPLAWLLAIARKETGFQNLRSAPGARDDVLGGAWGPMQVTAETARTLGFEPKLSLGARGKRILSDISIGICLGAQLVARLRDQLGADLIRIAAGYNAGAGRVLKGRVPATTREKYVPAVLRYAAEYEDVTG